LNHLDTKSDINLLAAEELIKLNYHAPSVHCSYYSVVQKCTVICCLELKKTVGEFKSMGSQWKGKGGSHVFLYQQIRNQFKSKRDYREDLREFENNFQDLKKYRNKSDYEDFPITSSESNDALTKTNISIQKLNKVFL
jgi:hypothetical protein